MDLLTVTDVKYLGDYVLRCAFNSGVVKKVDMTPLLAFPAYNELKDENLFKQFSLDDTIFWSTGADISPEWLFENGVEVS
jgi:hypothetical protein